MGTSAEVLRLTAQLMKRLRGMHVAAHHAPAKPGRASRYSDSLLPKQREEDADTGRWSGGIDDRRRHVDRPIRLPPVVVTPVALVLGARLFLLPGALLLLTLPGTILLLLASIAIIGEHRSHAEAAERRGESDGQQHLAGPRANILGPRHRGGHFWPCDGVRLGPSPRRKRVSVVFFCASDMLS